ncbi:hypothetical protein [Algoriphagus pacificus]|uniref:Uncharacterized protein n=1 Tax=Algoriphagus pacificus TaxID=2811234 RepID=A0ABS3CJL6_9BACT|nr:hypothetical protein [Algoriphagus pacificus]MBN7817297.1 hypothetical protein [Algoriphagus pacificus]
MKSFLKLALFFFFWGIPHKQKESVQADENCQIMEVEVAISEDSAMYHLMNFHRID